jgi:hypothetical protein
VHITGMRSKYYVLSVLGALVVALGVLAVAPSAQAQQEPPPAPPTLDKECTPNPVHVGQTLTCSFTLTVDANSVANVLFFADTFPIGIRPISVLDTANCIVVGQTVTCEYIANILINNQDVPETFLLNEVDAIAEQCGTFRNTARVEGFVQSVVGGVPGPPVPFTAEDTEVITVVGCDETGGAARGGGVGFEIGDANNESGEITTENDYSISP